MNRTRILMIPILTLLTLAFISSPAIATPLPAGGTVVASAFVGAPGALVASNSATFVSSLGVGDFSGSVSEGVYLEGGGTYDFVYQFTNNAGGTKNIEQMSVAAFDSFVLDVQQSVTAFDIFAGGGTLSTTVDRSPSGGNVAWKDSWTPGSTSAILMVKTNANSYTTGTISFINSGTVTLGPAGFFSAAVVPEPTFYGLLGAGLIGLIWVSRKQKASQPNN
jgi:hypothetical protein